MLANLSTLLVTLVTLGAAVQAAPTHTEVKRSTTSNGINCYFKCPTVDSFGYYGQECASFISSTGGVCSYDCAGVTTSCTYNAADDTLSSADTGMGCPSTTTMDCSGAASPGSQEFKRDYKVRRSLTRAERIIADRQFKPAKVVA